MPKKHHKTSSPVYSPRSREISAATRIQLAVAAGGRCEFRGCNEFLFEHPLTLTQGNYSQYAHIVAFSERGPRAHDGRRPANIHSVSNLMLLCHRCHKLIDDNADSYPRAALLTYKSDHEDRIRHLTGLAPDMRTTVVQLKARIAGDAVDIPISHVTEAVAPRYPSDRRGCVIDLTGIAHDGPGFVQAAEKTIAHDAARLYDAGMDVDQTRHISLFALAPIHLLVYLGTRLSNKIPVEFYQRHRDGSDPWTWKQKSDQRARYRFSTVRKGTNPSKVALLLSLSGTIRVKSLPKTIADDFALYQIKLTSAEPNTDFLRQRDDLEAFRRTYRLALATITRLHPGLSDLSLFPAVPAPVGVACGYDLLPKVHPNLSVYDFDKGSGGFTLRTRIVTNEKYA